MKNTRNIFSGILFITLFFSSFLVYSQINFDSDDENAIRMYGAQNTIVYNNFKETFAAGDKALKAAWTDEMLTNKIKKFEKIENLQILLLNNNYLADFSSEFGKLKNLFILSSKKNGIIYLDPAISNCSSLMYLELFDTKLDSLPKSIAKLRSLELFRMVNNQSDTLRIPKEFTYIRGLRDLQIFDCKLYRLPNDLQNFDRMERFVVSGCRLDSISNNFGYMKKLKYCDISHNHLKSIPASFSKLENLEYLDISYNQLTEIPENFIYLKKLETLDIRGNNIKEENYQILKLSLPKCKIISDFQNKGK